MMESRLGHYFQFQSSYNMAIFNARRFIFHIFIISRHARFALHAAKIGSRQGANTNVVDFLVIACYAMTDDKYQ